MFKIIILLTVLTTVFGNIHGGAVIAHPVVAPPTGVSHQSRHDVIHPGVLTYSTAHSVPVAVHAPATVAVHTPVIRPSSAVTHESRHTVGTAIAVVGHGGYGVGAGISGGYGLGGGFGLGAGNGLAEEVGGIGVGIGSAGGHYGGGY